MVRDLEERGVVLRQLCFKAIAKTASLKNAIRSRAQMLRIGLLGFSLVIRPSEPRIGSALALSFVGWAV
jgi:hypothetical protein